MIDHRLEYENQADDALDFMQRNDISYYEIKRDDDLDVFRYFY
jgi:hypothetical protein